MVHRIVWRVASEDSLAFWEERLAREGVNPERTNGRLRFSDPEGIDLELAVVTSADEPLRAEHPDVPAEYALQGFDGVRAYSAAPDASRRLLEETLEFAPKQERGSWEVRGERRGSSYAYDPPPAGSGVGGAGTVHHVAWASAMDDHAAWSSIAEAHATWWIVPAPPTPLAASGGSYAYEEPRRSPRTSQLPPSFGVNSSVSSSSRRLASGAAL